MTKLSIIAASLTLALLSPLASAEPANAPSKAQRLDLDRAETAFLRYLNSWALHNTATDNIAAIFAEGAVIEVSLQRAEWTLNIDGRNAIAEYLGDLGKIGSQWSFSNVHFFPTLEQGVVFAQYEVSAHSQIAGQELNHRNVVAIEMRGGQIARIRDFGGGRLINQTLLGSTPVAMDRTASLLSQK